MGSCIFSCDWILSWAIPLLFIDDFVEACNIPRAKVLTINFFSSKDMPILPWSTTWHYTRLPRCTTWPWVLWVTCRRCPPPMTTTCLQGPWMHLLTWAPPHLVPVWRTRRAQTSRQCTTLLLHGLHRVLQCLSLSIVRMCLVGWRLSACPVSKNYQ